MLAKSDTFKSMIQGIWKEAIDSQIKLREWDLDTVARLLQWLYTADYASPYPHSPGSHPQENSDTLPSASAVNATLSPLSGSRYGFQSGASTTNTSPCHGNPNSCTNEVREPVCKTSYYDDFVNWTQQFAGLNPILSHSEALMAHAKLYALAEYALLPQLKAQVAQRLRFHILFIGKPQADPAAMKDIAVLARYVYANTTGRRTGGVESEEPLRRSISGFIAQNFAAFVGPEAEQVIAEGGELTVDIFAKLRIQSAMDKEAEGTERVAAEKQKRSAPAHASATPAKKRQSKGAARASRS